jgi:hypothetical protein
MKFLDNSQHCSAVVVTETITQHCPIHGSWKLYFARLMGPCTAQFIYPTEADDKGTKGSCVYPTRIAPEMAHKLDENFN